MNYELIAMDLDGTLNNDQKTIDLPTLEALMAAQQAGIRLALASARLLPLGGKHVLTLYFQTSVLFTPMLLSWKTGSSPLAFCFS